MIYVLLHLAVTSQVNAITIVVILIILNTVVSGFPKPSDDLNDQGGPPGSNHASDEPTWPKEMDLCFVPGLERLMLTIQCPLIHTIVQDANEIVQDLIMHFQMACAASKLFQSHCLSTTSCCWIKIIWAKSNAWYVHNFVNDMANNYL